MRDAATALFVFTFGLTACSGATLTPFQGSPGGGEEDGGVTESTPDARAAEDAAPSSNDATPAVDAHAPPQDAATADATAPVDAGKAAQCTGKFGSELTDAFGRIDATVLAVVTPADTQCPLPNRDHVIFEVVFHGAAYRVLVNVQSDRGGADPRVRIKTLDAPLQGGAWAEGWHPGASLDYASDLGAHDADFTAYDLDALSDQIASYVTIGDKVSIFATSSGGQYASSAHLVHRNGSSNDGAIVLGATTAKPRWLLFRFDEQAF